MHSMFISSTLRRAQCHVRANHHRWRHAACLRARPYAKSRMVGSGSGADNSAYVPRSTLGSPMPMMIRRLQNNNFSTNKGGKVMKPRQNLLLNTAENTSSSEHDPRDIITMVASRAKRRPHMLHVPKVFLHNCFSAAYGQGLVGSFEVYKKGHKGKTIYTATFTDPLTKELFPSGTGLEIDVESHPSARLSPPLHLAGAKVFDGKVYYDEARHAEHAAAARAIDCYNFREESDDKSSLRLCLEEPYGTIENGSSQRIYYDALLEQKSSKGQLLAAKKSHPEKTSSILSSMAVSKPHLLHAPKNILLMSFGYLKKRSSSYFDVEVKDYEGTPIIFTASFTDPTTKETFLSGLGTEIDVERRSGSSPKTPFHAAEVKIIDGKVYYTEAKLAEHAAAARALDCYFAREGNVDIRLCLEDPYLTVEEGASQQVDYDALLSQRSLSAINRHHKAVVHEENDQRDLLHTDAGSHLTKEIDEVEPSNVDLPAPTFSFDEDPVQVHHQLSTLGRIVDLWTDTAGIDSSAGSSTPWPIIKTTHMYENISQSPSAKVGSILDWYDHVNKEPQNQGDVSALAKLCSNILVSLSNANRELDLGEEENPIDVEEKAKSILERIIKLSSGGENDLSFINADTFNAYIHCLSRLDPTNSAKTAEELLKSMANSEQFSGIELPRPNVGTYNAAMALWALVDGAEGSNGVNSIYSLLEGASMGNIDGSFVRPDTETLKTLLFVNSKIEGRFSFEQAKAWLGKIQQISNSVCGEEFTPDATFYNAALASMPKHSTPIAENSYSKSWLLYGSEYIGGFKSTGETSNTEATDMAKWLLHAEECGVDPNVEMYEAIIQAWIKTGTKDGLLIAEEWAKRAVSSSAALRLNTFHPIIAAWAMCQFERSPDRVKEWNNQLTTVSASTPNLKPDLSTLSAQFIAWRNVQVGLKDKLIEENQATPDQNLSQSSFESGKEVEMAFAAARNCSQYLHELFPKGIRLDSPQETQAIVSMLAHTIESWGCASRFALLHPSNSLALDTSQGVNEMVNLARLFDTIIDKDESHEHSEHMLRIIGESFAEILSQLHSIDSVMDSDASTPCYFSAKFHHVERMLRDFEFYSRKHVSQSKFTPESKSVRHQLYKEILQGCAGVTLPRDNGHVVRICRLVMDQLSRQNEICADNFSGGSVDEDITHIYVDIAGLAGTVVQNPHERMYILTTIYNNASQFFELTKWKKKEESRYATVDKARLIGAMRMAMGDSELTEQFLCNFDKQPRKKRSRGNTFESYVEELLGMGKQR